MAPMMSASENLLFLAIHASVHQGIIGGPISGFHVNLTCLLKTGPFIAKKLTLSASHGEAHAKESIHGRADGQDRA
jgi:hypothetical protein